ncbi:MAG: hypothetical protein GXO94_06965 [Nitrospirae bacterium]|nr:hypothetical protein [Nitrospirota bacterium]
MEKLDLKGIDPVVSERIAPFAGDIMKVGAGNLHSFHIVGSALTADFNRKTSDINSVVVLKEMDLGFVEALAPLGRKYRKKGVAAPLIMTPQYIMDSLDVFPVEFFNFRLIHHTVFGDDILEGLKIEERHLRLQCEREIKTKLIWLRQGYISSLGDKRLLSERLAESITGYIPLFRAVLHLLGKEPPVRSRDVVIMLQETTSIETGIFEKGLLLKRKETSLSADELTSFFEEYYMGTEKIGKIINELGT